MEILLIEDNEGDVELFREAVQDEALTCILSVVNNGREAVYRLLQQGQFRGAARPHLIFLDLNLPGMTGKLLLDLIKSDTELKTIPIVILTSSRAPADIQETYCRHANCYMVKPFDPDEFRNSIRLAIAFWGNAAQLPQEAAAR